MQGRDYPTARGGADEDHIAALALEYYELIGRDHHKDRDCHWSIEKRWSYGEFKGYYVQHNGYCYERCGQYGEDGPFPTHAEALGVLERHLRQAIASARAWHGEEGEIPPAMFR